MNVECRSGIGTHKRNIQNFLSTENNIVAGVTSLADIEGEKEAEGVWEYGVEENIWVQEGRGNGGMEETA